MLDVTPPKPCEGNTHNLVGGTSESSEIALYPSERTEALLKRTRTAPSE